ILTVAPHTPPELIEVVEKCLRRNPDDRWPTMEHLHAAVDRLKQHSDSRSSAATLVAPRPSDAPTVVAQPPKSPAGRKRKRLLVAAIIAVGAAADGLWLWKRLKSTPLRPASADEISAAPTNPTAAKPAPDVLTNDSIVQMAEGHVPIPVIMDAIRSSKSQF